MINEIIESRIERCQATLPQAVQSSDGAHFRMLLSLISSNESFGYRGAREASQGGFTLPSQAEPHYPDPDSLYTSVVVDRLNRAVNGAQRGELAYAASWLDTQAQIPEGQTILGDAFERFAMRLNGKLMLAEVEAARTTLSARA